MKNNMTRVYEDLIHAGLLRIRKGKLSLKRRHSVTREQLLNNPKYEISRRNLTEFKLCAVGGKLLRDCLLGFGKFDSHVHPRLHSLLHKILRTDTAHQMGSRSIMQGDITLLKGFQFNKHSDTLAFWYPGLTSKIDSCKGKAILQVNHPKLELDCNWPESAESVEIDSMLISINFDEGLAEQKRATSPKIFRQGKKKRPIKLVTEVSESRNRILIHCVAVRFFSKEINGKFYQINNRKLNPVGIVSVEKCK